MNTEHNKIDDKNSSEEMVEMPTTITEKKHTTKHAETEVETSIPESEIYENFGKWSKIYAVLGFIYAGFAILVGIPYIIALGFGLLMIAAGVFYIMAYNKVIKSSDLVKSLSKLQSSPKEFKNTTDEIIINLTSYFKIISIINISAIIASTVITILFVVFFAAAFSAFYQNVSPNESGTSTIDFR